MKPAISRSETRLLLLRGVIAVVVVVLIGRLWQLQMVEGASYSIRSDRNRFREVDVAAPRGVIYDRNGKILARNRPSFTIAVVPGDLPKTREGEPDPAKTPPCSIGCSTCWRDRRPSCVPARRRPSRQHRRRAARTCRRTTVSKSISANDADP